LEIHQVLVAAARGDAITNEALRLRDLLRRGGRSEIYAQHIDPRVPGVKRLAEYAELPFSARQDNMLVYHSSIGEAAVATFLSTAGGRLVLRYHNMTPPEMIAPFDTVLARKLEEGRRELVKLRSRAHRSIAVSRFNATELDQLGFPDVTVVPLLMDLEGLHRAQPEPGVASQLMVKDGEPLVSFVGRVAPNKGHAALIQAFHVLKTYHRPDSHLFIVGSDEIAAYRESLVALVQQLALKDLRITGSVSLGQLADVYRRTDVFVCLSAHEGFCAPLVEAMSFGIPIVALAEAAIPETVGDAAILLDEPSPTLAAEAVRMLLDDRDLRAALVERGRRRAADFDPGRTGEALAGAIKQAA
jgi:glycosyltransferase involved in cell wall biosynthesis